MKGSIPDEKPRTYKTGPRYAAILLRDQIPLAQGLETQRRHGVVSHPPLQRE
jgi:hypothetical protein